MKKSKNSIKIVVRGSSQMLSLNLPKSYCGRRTSIALNISNNPENWMFAEFKAKQIEMDYVTGHFDSSLIKYKPVATFVVKKSEVNFLEIYQNYIDSKKKLISPTTWKGTYINTLNHLNSCPYKTLDKALEFKDWILANKTLDAAKRILMQINAACTWAIERRLIEFNPFAGKTKIKTKKSKPKIHPFSVNEKRSILVAFEEFQKFSYLLPLIKFFFLTGCRTSEAIGLQWKHVKADCTVISFEEVMILAQGGAQRKQGTKQSPQRDFPCNAQLRELLLSIRPSKPIGTASVFLRLDGSPITHQNLRTAWYGKGKELGIVKQLAADGGIDGYRPQYNTRHTFISQCLEAGIPPLQISKWVGNSPEIIFRNYAGIISKLEVPEF